MRLYKGYIDETEIFETTFENELPRLKEAYKDVDEIRKVLEVGGVVRLSPVSFIAASKKVLKELFRLD